jgi:uncharacterized protein YjeT (DUF2065 family)
VSDLLAALCLVLVLEGLLPFLAPARWRETMQRLSELSDGQLRTIGLACIMAGLAGWWAMQIWL